MIFTRGHQEKPNKPNGIKFWNWKGKILKTMRDQRTHTSNILLFEFTIRYFSSLVR
jgi:hypothetical protein